MVTIVNLRESHPTRPRHYIVTLGVFSFLLVCLCAFLTIGFAYFPALFEFLNNYEITFMGTKSTLFSFSESIFVPFACFFLLLIPFFTLANMANHRAIYWILMPFALILFFCYLACQVFVTFPTLYDYISIENFSSIVSNAFFYIRLAYMGILLLGSFLAILYCATPCIKYKEIYQLRTARIYDAKEKHNKDEIKRIKKDFYRYYKERKFNELLALLYDESGLEADAPMAEGAMYMLLGQVQRAERTIREAEFRYLYDQGDYALIRYLHARNMADAKTSDVGERKSQEDKALREYIARKMAKAEAEKKMNQK